MAAPLTLAGGAGFSVREFRVAVRDDTGACLGCLDGTPLLTEARETLSRVRRAYPRSMLQGLFNDGDLGAWREVTEADLDRIADLIAARTLACILTLDGLPRLAWTVNNLDPGILCGSANTPEQVSEYARALGLELQETERYGTSTLILAQGAYKGVDVRVSCYRRAPVPVAAEVEVADGPASDEAGR
ncbi:hypothetical protein BKM31_44490 [[Actinomadura] parvosata subsp. kistnae]|uniref:Uncharacterized protein n=1 Tax=[Actinomadura] parvosata subsp. kistnae TaxID=1909395 RepID=A0A1V0ABL4_9ACTN|nr:hypothetical protein [Nonomuraea sp. ATCC 55076]AQZ67587.1 hypothetical protein BKM31_44490 [Nonomuraea sp. ATCC 55076]